jgi:hypothetical protein
MAEEQQNMTQDGDGEDRGYSWTRAAPEEVDEDEEDETLMEGVDDLPLFASEANKEVHAEVQAKEKKLESVNSELDEHKGRVGIMGEHLKNVQQELLHTQALVDAKTREIETEDHLKQLAERETGRYKQVRPTHHKPTHDLSMTYFLLMFIGIR